MSWLILLLPVAIGAWSLVSLRAQSRTLQDHWHHAADVLGLAFHPAPWWRAYPTMSGDHGGIPITVVTRRRLGLRRGWAWELRSEDQVDTVIELELRLALPGGLALRPQGLLDTMVTAVGGQDLVVGDRAFDDATRVRGDDEASVRSLLSDEVLRSSLLDLWSRLPRSELSQRRLVAKLRGAELTSTQLVSAVERLVGVAGALRDALEATCRQR